MLRGRPLGFYIQATCSNTRRRRETKDVNEDVQHVTTKSTFQVLDTPDYIIFPFGMSSASSSILVSGMLVYFHDMRQRIFMVAMSFFLFVGVPLYRIFVLLSGAMQSENSKVFCGIFIILHGTPRRQLCSIFI
jgi:hypothetical protein